MNIKILPTIAKTKAVNKAVDWALKEKTVIKAGVENKVSNYGRLQKAFPTAFMVWLVAIQCGFFAKSKDMPKERKVPLILNNLYTCSMALGAGFLMKKPIDKMTDKFVKRAEVLYSGADKKVLVNGIKNGIPFLTAVMLFHYFGPVIATPLSTHTTNYLAKKGLVKFPKKADK